MTLILVRHARAGDRSKWQGDDHLRPLDSKGSKQAARLADVLAGVDVRRIVSSPYLRCVQTVEPLAAALGLEIEHAPELGAERHGPEGPALLASLLGEQAVVSVHGGIEAALDLDLPFRKGAVWLFRDALDDPEVVTERL